MGRLLRTTCLAGAAALVLAGSARAAAAGSPDPAFGFGGAALTPFFAPGPPATMTAADASAVAVQPDGKILVGGSSDPDGSTTAFALARYNANGSLDTGFGTGGRVVTELGPAKDSEIDALGLQSDGKIIAAGAIAETVNGFPTQHLGFVRYDRDGTQDTTFGSGPQHDTVFSNGAADNGEAVRAVAIESDDTIVAAVDASTDTARFMGIARLTRDGALDTTFHGTGMNGVAAGSTTTNSFARGVVVQPGGAVVIAGDATAAGPPTCNCGRFALARFTANGTLDTGFGPPASGGTVLEPLGTDGPVTGSALVALPDGRLVEGGGAFDHGAERLALAAFSANGVPDATFGTAGAETPLPVAPETAAAALAAQPDGKIVATGDSATPGQNASQVLVARLAGNGALDPSFGTGGVVRRAYGDAGVATGTGAVLQSDGKILVGGDASVGPGASATDEFLIARYLGAATAPPPPAVHRLTVTRAGSGTVRSTPAGIACGAACSASFTAGTSVTLTASPASGHAFRGWTGAGCSGVHACRVTLAADTTVRATFAAKPKPKPKPNVRVGHEKAGRGGALVPVACAHARCIGTVALTTGVKVRKRHRTLTVGHSTFTLAAGKKKTVTVALTGVGRRLLAKAHRLQVTVVVTLGRGHSARRASSRHLTLTARKRTHKHP